LSGVQETGAQGSLDIQLACQAEAGVGFGCEEGRVYGFETSEQG
jgi:hypothetical protein